MRRVADGRSVSYNDRQSREGCTTEIEVQRETATDRITKNTKAVSDIGYRKKTKNKQEYHYFCLLFMETKHTENNTTIFLLQSKNPVQGQTASTCAHHFIRTDSTITDFIQRYIIYLHFMLFINASPVQIYSGNHTLTFPYAVDRPVIN